MKTNTKRLQQIGKRLQQYVEHRKKYIVPIVFFVNVAILFRAIYTIYLYNFSGMLFLYMEPKILIYTAIMVGLLGILFCIFQKKIKFILFIILNLIIWGGYFITKFCMLML